MKQKLYSIFNYSEENHWWFLARRRILLGLLKRSLPVGPRPRILDVGCGTGETLKQLEKLGNPTGVDISPAAIQFCRERGCDDLHLVDGIILPSKNEEFDIVLSLDVIEHLEDDAAALREYRRVIKPGGVLFITVPAYRWLWSGHDDDNLHLRRYTKKELTSRLLETGFRIERSTYFCTYLFGLIAAVRMVGNMRAGLFGRRKEGADFKIPGRVLNKILMKIFFSEFGWLKHHNLPFGSSLLVICKK
ncbi:MAG: class I SAM-dependent methyltransferase [Candidatus Auribacterota bacterium]|nr:class I SAM-dependent methyltransferase [Candidatus Auribacterota bacterium]